MYKYQKDIDLIQELDQKRNGLCYFCDGKSKYTQPEKSSGVIINVCEKHFSYKHFA